MTQRNHPVIPITAASNPPTPNTLALPAVGAALDNKLALTAANLRDALNRPLRDLRISVTDQCNFRCTYCMPRAVFDKHHTFLRQDELLSFDEIVQFVRAAIPLGVEKIRLTGGEPLLRKDLAELIAALSDLRRHDDKPLDITLTTNAALLTQKAPALKAAGLNRITVSLDALDESIFQTMNDAAFSVQSVLDGIDAAQALGFNDLKVNMVVQKGVNDSQILPMARYFKDRGITLRFIEFMDVGASNQWQAQHVLPSAQIVAMLDEAFGVQALPHSKTGEVAARWAYKAGGEFGVISSVSEPFCSDCNRVRLSANGQLFLCLFANAGYDIKPLLSSKISQAALTEQIAAIWLQRSDQYSALRRLKPTSATTKDSAKVEMSFIGG